MKTLLNRKNNLNKKIEKLVEETSLHEAVKREMTAESKIEFILEEISNILRQKGVKFFQGDTFTLKID